MPSLPGLPGPVRGAQDLSFGCSRGFRLVRLYGRIGIKYREQHAGSQQAYHGNDSQSGRPRHPGEQPVSGSGYRLARRRARPSAPQPQERRFDEGVARERHEAAQRQADRQQTDEPRRCPGTLRQSLQDRVVPQQEAVSRYAQHGEGAPLQRPDERAGPQGQDTRADKEDADEENVDHRAHGRERVPPEDVEDTQARGGGYPQVGGGQRATQPLRSPFFPAQADQGEQHAGREKEEGREQGELPVGVRSGIQMPGVQEKDEARDAERPQQQGRAAPGATGGTGYQEGKQREQDVEVNLDIQVPEHAVDLKVWARHEALAKRGVECPLLQSPYVLLKDEQHEEHRIVERQNPKSPVRRVTTKVDGIPPPQIPADKRPVEQTTR